MLIRKNLRDELKNKVNFLKQIIWMKCKKCGQDTEFAKLDFFMRFVTENSVRCPRCKKKYDKDDAEEEFSYIPWYQMLFMRGIYVWRFQGDVRSTIIEVFTALEVFLADVLYEIVRKRKKVYRPIIDSLLSGDIELSIRHYRKIFERMKLKITRRAYIKTFRDKFDKLHYVQDIRNNVVHRGVWPSFRQVKNTILIIGNIFNLLEEYY